MAPVLADLEALALRDLGEGIQRAYRGELQSLQALLYENETVLAITTGAHYLRTGIFVVTPQRIMFGVKKWFRYYHEFVFVFDCNLVVQILQCDLGQKRNFVLLGLKGEQPSPYLIGLGSRPPEPISLTREIVSLARDHGCPIAGEERLQQIDLK
jgi:hypothetical protein